MKLNQIKQAYKKLNLIVHKKRFLIPSKPIRPLNPYIKFISVQKQLINSRIAELRKSIEQNQQIDMKGRKIYNDTVQKLIQQCHPAYIKIKDQYPIQLQKFNKGNNEYIQKYVKPLQKVKISPYVFFIQNYYKQIDQKNSQRKQRYSTLKLLGKQWRQLMGGNQQQGQSHQQRDPEKEQFRRQFMEKYEKMRQKNLQAYQQYIMKHQIPEVKNITGYHQYISDKKNQLGLSKLESSIFEQYSSLNEQKKRQYNDRARQKVEMYKKNYQQFLKRWDLTHEKLQDIKNICEKYEQVFDKSQKRKTKQIISKQKHNKQI